MDRPASPPGRVFRSKIDAWLVVVLLGTTVGLLVHAAWALHSDAASATRLAVIVAFAVLAVWPLASTTYTVTADDLVVRCGLFRWRIPRREITRVSPSRSILSGPALSTDRLEIRYARGRRSVLISPRDREAFLDALAVDPRTPTG